jgi:hypothetical protein
LPNESPLKIAIKGCFVTRLLPATSNGGLFILFINELQQTLGLSGSYVDACLPNGGDAGLKLLCGSRDVAFVFVYFSGPLQLFEEQLYLFGYPVAFAGGGEGGY